MSVHENISTSLQARTASKLIAAMSSPIELREAGATFGEKGLYQINIEIKAGSRVAVMGPSGSGKSSLLKLVAGLIHPSCGSRLVSGTIGYLPQDSKFLVLPWKRVGQHIGAEAALAVGLEDRLNACPLDLSGGELRRLAVAYVFSREKDIYLLDEPLTGLDIYLRKKVTAFMEAKIVNRISTVVFVTHYVEEAKDFHATVGILVNGGKAHVVGDIDELSKSIT